MNKKKLAYGIFCYVSALIFFVIGGGMTAYLVDIFFNSDDGILVATILLPFSIIFIIMGVAVFKMAGRILNASEQVDEAEEIEN